MGCDFPIKAYRSSEKSEGGKLLLTFNPLKALNSTSPFEVPCNNCMGCRLDRSLQWATRIVHESKMWERNSFLTLTYDAENLPTNYSLDVRHTQLFMKRLRESLPQKIRFFGCGEYGEKGGRPHYHIIIFNHDFNDKILYTIKNGNKLYTSTTLTNLWQLGHATTGDVTPESAAYVARYTTKKYTGKLVADHYYRLSPVDGQYYSVKPEFGVMSRRPGIGATWLEKFRDDVFPSGFIVVDGQKRPPPRFYVNKLKEEEQQLLKRQARARSRKHKEHNTTERRFARAAVRDDRIKNLKRTLE